MDIDTIIFRLADHEDLPKREIAAAIEAREAVLDRVLDIIKRAIARERGETSRDTIDWEEEVAFTFLLLVLAELGEKRVFKPLLELMHLVKFEDESLLDDGFSENVTEILIATYDGDREALVRLIEDSEADEFKRTAAFEVWTWLAAKEEWPLAESEAYLRRAFDELQPQAENNVWVPWVMAIAILGLEEMTPLAMEVLKAPRFKIDKFMDKEIVPIDVRDYEKAVSERKSYPDKDEWLRRNRLAPFGSAIEELSKWYCYSDKYKRERRRKGLAEAMIETVVNENRHVGRNDPCPCGSGKKYKKCCLG